MNPVSFVVFPREKTSLKTQIRRTGRKSDANPMQIPCTSLCQAHIALLNSCRGVLPLCCRNRFGSSPCPHALLLLSALLESVLAMRIKQKKRGRGRGKRGRKRTRKRKRKRNLRLEKDLLPTRSSLIQAGSSGSKCFTHPSGGKKLPILPQARSSSGCAALTCVAALHAKFNFVF